MTGARGAVAPGSPASTRFIAFHASPAPEAPGTAGLSFALVVAETPAGVVLVHNRRRRVWELPGGFIDAGETIRDAARREFAEEVGCSAGALAWRGVVEVDDGQRRFGAVFTCVLPALPASAHNEEIDGVAAWTPTTAPRPLAGCDGELLAGLFAAASTPAPSGTA